MQEDDVNCQGDEFSPDVLWQGRDSAANGQAWIRQVPGSQNNGAGAAYFGNICPDKPKSATTNSRSLSEVVIGCRATTRYSLTGIITWPALVMRFSGTPNFGVGDSDRLTANPCWPSSLIQDPRWALLTNDPWYNTHLALKALVAQNLYLSPPEATYTSGKINRPDWNKRDLVMPPLDDFDPDDLAWVEGNSTRKATDEELGEQFGFYKCADAECSAEKQALGIESAMIRGVRKTTPATIIATTTSLAKGAAAPTQTSTLDIRVASAVLPQITGMPAPPKKSKQQMQKELRELHNRSAS